MSDSGTVAALRRYPVKSMLGEDLDQAALTSAGFEGDREIAVIDRGTGDVATAKHPQRWRGLLALAARWNDGAPVITLPDGTSVAVGDPHADQALSGFLGRAVRLSTTAYRCPRAVPGSPASVPTPR